MPTEQSGRDRAELGGRSRRGRTARAQRRRSDRARCAAKIERLGPVNMMAIEQFDELETRHAFLTTQRKDLVDSIAQTSEAIKRIDETTRQRFTEAFAAINHNFQDTFSTLFGGGRAGLTLLDENDPLESGIEIIAQPPGKRLQSVQLLSGGEKALTAIALMFGHVQVQAEPVLPARRDRRAARRRQHRPVRGDAARHAGAHAVHPHHAQPEDDGDRRPALRRDDGGARRVQADFRPVELTRPSPRVCTARGGRSMELTRVPRARRRCSCRWRARLAGCDVSPRPPHGPRHGRMDAQLSLGAGGEVHIVNTNGRIEVEGVDGSTVEVRAEKIAAAATDAAARELLPRIVIKEDSSPTASRSRPSG